MRKMLYATETTYLQVPPVTQWVGEGIKGGTAIKKKKTARDMEKLTIKIEAEFGSEFQERTAREALLAAISAWQNFYRERHKKNSISVNISEHLKGRASQTEHAFMGAMESMGVKFVDMVATEDDELTEE